SIVTIMSPQGTLTPFAAVPSWQDFRVAGIFESGFYDFDAGWAYTSLAAAQKLLQVGDEVNGIELRLDNLDLAPQVAKADEAAAGPRFAATTWQEQNRQLFRALEIEKMVRGVTIGLVELVEALNILIARLMTVLEMSRN